MVTVLGANSVTGGYEVDNSVRLFSNTSMTMTPSGAPTNADINTISFWCKLSALGTNRNPISAGASGAFNFRADDKLQFYNAGGTLRTDRLFRDVSAWYHVVVATDTTDGTANDRLKMYINGVQETSFTSRTNPNQNANTHLGSAVEHHIGCNTNAANFFNGYLAEVCFIDGTALLPTSFGEFDDNGIWRPKDVSSLTYGKNGFYLEFKSGGNLGDEDKGTQTADWSETNLTAVDQSTDTCTNNFATLNSIDSFSSGATFSEGNTTVVSTNGGRGIMTATVGLTSGKWYWEVKNSASGGTHSGDEWNHIGISNRAAANADNILAESGTNSNKVYEYTYYAYDGNHYNNGDQGGYGASFTTNDIVGVFLDLDNNKIYWSKNGAWADGSGNSDENDPNGFKAVTDPASTPGGVYIPACGDGGVNVFKTWQWNFGGTPGFAVSSSNADPNGYGNFEYPTEGGYAICSKNLAEFGG